MLKTYLYIPENLEQQIRETAQLQNMSKAEVIRRALKEGIASVRQQGNASAKVLLKIAKLGRKYKVKGPKDAVERFDEYLYGVDWNQDE